MIATTAAPGHTRYLLAPREYELATRAVAAWWNVGDSVLSPSGLAVVAVEAARIQAAQETAAPAAPAVPP